MTLTTLTRRRPSEKDQLRAEARTLSRTLVHERNVRHELEREVQRLRRELVRARRD